MTLTQDGNRKGNAEGPELRNHFRITLESKNLVWIKCMNEYEYVGVIHMIVFSRIVGKHSSKYGT
jgi:hypothetical protein